MIDQQAKVVDITSDTIWVEAERQSSCDSCKVKQGCGTKLLAKHVGQRFNRIAVDKTQNVILGQQVTLAIPEQALLQGTTWMYLLPIIILLVFAIVARELGAGEGWQIISGAMGFGLSLLTTHHILKRKTADFHVSMKEE